MKTVRFKIADVFEVEVENDATQDEIDAAVDAELKKLAEAPFFLENAEVEFVDEEENEEENYEDLSVEDLDENSSEENLEEDTEE